VSILKAKINEAIIKTLLTSTPLMSHQYRYSQPEEYSGNMCFHILGFDILITESFDPLLLEVNHTPSFTTDTPLDTYIKHKLIKDTLILMNINSKTKTTLFHKAKQYNSDRLLTGKRQIYQGEVKQR
jgi:tubulin polyglutamylase TTLL6/13